MGKKNKKPGRPKSKKKSLCEDIADTEEKMLTDPDGPVYLRLSLKRTTYAKLLHHARDFGYRSSAEYAQELVRRAVYPSEPIAHTHPIEPTGASPEGGRIGFEKEGEHRGLLQSIVEGISPFAVNPV